MWYRKIFELKNFFPFVVIFYCISFYGKAQSKYLNTIEICTKDSSVKINNITFKEYDILQIKKILGKPDRTLIDTIHTYMEEFGYKGQPPTSFQVVMYQKYFIYDEIGIMFTTEARRYSPGNLSTLYIFTSNTRMFTNREAPVFHPKKNYSGEILFNQDTVKTEQTIIPPTINYKSDGFIFKKIQFGLTSIGGIIDGMYSKDSWPYVMILLDDSDKLKISCIEVKL